jgi:hypothetical protein
MSNPTLTLSEAIQTVIWSVLSTVNTCLPGRIESYSDNKASVQPLIKRKNLSNTVETLPIISNVPVVFPRTQTTGITFPIKKGDGCLLVFSQRAMERFLSSGEIVEPGDSRKFDLTDAIAIPGLFSFNASALASNNTDVEIHNNNQKIVIKENGDIEIGASSLLKLITENFKSLFDNHVHNVSTVGSATAQAGITSSPVKEVGTDPVGVSSIPTAILYAFGDLIKDAHLTKKVKAQ